MKTVISPKLSEFMLISNLTAWHYSCRNSFNHAWRNYPQPLTTEEDNLLTKLKRIFVDYLRRFNEHPAIEFVDQKSFSWSELATTIDQPDSQIIHQAMDKFLPRFNYHYSKQKSNMRLVGRTIDNLLKENLSALDQTAIFYGYKDNDQCRVFLTLSHNANKSAGGMYLHINNQGFVILEFGDYDSSNSIPLANVLYHELGHHFQESRHWKNLVTQLTETVILQPDDKKHGVTEHDVINEVVHASLWGEYGFLSQQALKLANSKINFIKKGSPDSSYYERINLCAYHFQPSIKQILQDLKPCPKQIVTEAIKLWNRFSLQNS